MKVIDEIENAVTDQSPYMWYFPGNAATIMRIAPLCNSLVNDGYNYFVASKTAPKPTVEALKKYQS